MGRCAQWIWQKEDNVGIVIDLYAAIKNNLTAKRRMNPRFAMSSGGVHLNHEVHTVLAAAVLKAWGQLI